MRIRKRHFYDVVNIRNIKPYRESADTFIMGASALYVVIVARKITLVEFVRDYFSRVKVFLSLARFTISSCVDVCTTGIERRTHDRY